MVVKIIDNMLKGALTELNNYSCLQWIECLCPLEFTLKPESQCYGIWRWVRR